MERWQRHTAGRSGGVATGTSGGATRRGEWAAVQALRGATTGVDYSSAWPPRVRTPLCHPLSLYSGHGWQGAARFRSQVEQRRCATAGSVAGACVGGRTRHGQARATLDRTPGGALGWALRTAMARRLRTPSSVGLPPWRGGIQGGGRIHGSDVVSVDRGLHSTDPRGWGRACRALGEEGGHSLAGEGCG